MERNDCGILKAENNARPLPLLETTTDFPFSRASLNIDQ